MYTQAYIASSSAVLYAGGSRLSMFANRSPRPDGGSPIGESKTESGIASRVSSKNDLMVYKVQEFN